jgi:hypothetical protein
MAKYFLETIPTVFSECVCSSISNDLWRLRFDGVLDETCILHEGASAIPTHVNDECEKEKKQRPKTTETDFTLTARQKL